MRGNEEGGGEVGDRGGGEGCVRWVGAVGGEERAVRREEIEVRGERRMGGGGSVEGEEWQ